MKYFKMSLEKNENMIMEYKGYAYHHILGL